MVSIKYTALMELSNHSQAVEAPTSQTAQEYISSQLQLEADAREALPYQFNTCTKPLGALRQTVFSCLTCNPPPSDPSASYHPAGVCYSCSISCHGEHELVELFSRRDFECDCGTSRILSTRPCSLRTNSDARLENGVQSKPQRHSNKYNQNFRNVFCGCQELYDPHKQEGTMFQCLGLGGVENGGCGEDWWHPECLMGVGKEWRKQGRKVTDDSILSSKKDKPTKVSALNEHQEPAGNSANSLSLEPSPHLAAQDADAVDGDDLPPGFPREEDFEHVICYKCVEAFPWIKRYARASGFLTFVEHNATSNNILLSETRAAERVIHSDFEKPPSPIAATSMKRSRGEFEVNHDVGARQQHKKLKGQDYEGSNHDAKNYCRQDANQPVPESQISMFLKEDFRDHLCRCPSCFPNLQQHPQLLDEEDTYEPPISDDGLQTGEDASNHSAGSTRSLLDRGEAALSNVDRVRAIEGVMAYNHMRDKVKNFLKPFADSGQAVGAEDIKQYFEKLRGDEQNIPGAATANNIITSDRSGNDEEDRRHEQGGY